MPDRTAVGGPVPESPLQGRENQRFGDNGERLVAGCIPVRFTSSEHTAETVEVLQVTSRGSKGWVFPKGGWEADEDLEIAAKRETVEEAGVRGSLESPILGVFPFQSKKVSTSACGATARKPCVAHMFVMVVEEELEQWPERGQRERGWTTLIEASSRLRLVWMREALLAWIRRNNWHSVGDVVEQHHVEHLARLSEAGPSEPLTNGVSSD